MHDEQPADALPAEPENKNEGTLWPLAVAVAESRDFPDCRTPFKALVRMQAGREMGVGPLAAVMGIRITAGRTSIDAQLMAACIKRSGRYDFRVTEHTDQVCTIEFTENGQPAGTSRFTMDDAKKAGLERKDTWKSYPRNLLWARALSNGARWYCSSIFGGAIYNHEELGVPIDAEGQAIGEAGGAGDICTREEREEIRRLAEACGQTEKDLLAKMGVQMLDQLSSFEAQRLIKQLNRKAGAAAKKEATPTAAAQPATPPAEAITPAQQMLADAAAEAAQPSTPEQHARIIELADLLEIEPENVREMIARRGCKKLAELDHLKAAALIEKLEGIAIDEGKLPPFDPQPPT